MLFVVRVAAAAIPLLFCLAPARPAAAQDRPTVTPTRDATVDYRMEGRAGGPPQTMRMSFAAGGGQTRMEMSGRPAVMITDRTAGKMLMIMTDRRQYMERPLAAQGGSGFDMAAGGGSGDSITRKGSETIAGQRCTVWESHGERSSSSCITDDGLVLRGESAGPNGERSSLLATAVSYAPLGPETFQPPPGFSRMEMPGGAMPGGGGCLGAGCLGVPPAPACNCRPG